ncbi:MAG: helix-turn-helix domain-containing protein [Campylobacteraceae bacterium]|nr:helix-turn-helix domain-containing protein [Campylobacteraceae bacterium]
MDKFFIEPIEFTDKEIRIFYKNIGEKVKKLRAEKGVSQLELALAIGFKTVSSVAKPEILIDNKHFNLEHLYKIAKVLDVDIKYFFE